MSLLSENVRLVLSQSEIKQLFDSIHNLKYWALLMTAYAGGLRTSEVVRLRLTDIDSERMVIRIHQGKGQKDRYVMLAPTLLKVLRQYWQQERHHSRRKSSKDMKVFRSWFTAISYSPRLTG